MRAEITCYSDTPCTSHFPCDHDMPGVRDGEFRHVMLVAQTPYQGPLDVANDYVCPACGEAKVRIERTVVNEAQKFATGPLYFTSGVQQLVDGRDGFRAWLAGALIRYVEGQWATEFAEDHQTNDEAVAAPESKPDHRQRILDAVKAPPDDTKLFIVTEAGRQSTTVMLADEY